MGTSSHLYPLEDHVSKPSAAVEEEIERLRQCVIESRNSPKVGPAAEKSLAKLRDMFSKHPGSFTAEDIRFVNMLRGALGVRLVAHAPRPKLSRSAKRKGDTLDHCWRCETPVDAGFTEICPACDSKAYHWRVCPVCKACGCQRSGKVLV